MGFPPFAAGVASTGAAHDVVVAARVLAAMDAKALSDDECLGVFDDIELVRRSLAAAAAGVLAQIDARDLCDVRYGTSTPVWFERRHGRSRSSVAQQARRAKTLSSTLPEVHAALGRGEITCERAELIASKVNDRNADAMAAAQQGLLALSAAEPTFSGFSALVADLARLADEDGAHDPEPATGRAHLGRTGDELRLSAVFVGVDAAVVEHLVEAATNRLWRRWRADCEQAPELEMPTRAELREQAIADLIRRGAAKDPANAKPVVAEMSLVLDADRVDDIDPILAAVLDGTGYDSFGRSDHRHSFGPDGQLGCCGAGRLVGVPVTTAAGTRVWFTPQQWQLLVCNADISEVLLDELGMPKAVRNRIRFPSRAMRRALVVRDGGCAFPGCDAAPEWCDAHHVIEWADGGDTVVVNLLLLCRHHHGIVHRTGWSIRLNRSARIDDDGQVLTGPAPGEGFFVITTAAGLEMHTQHRRRPGRGADGRQPAPV